MTLESYRELRLLTELSAGTATTQRILARQHGLALGLTNGLIRGFVRKGYLKIVTLDRKRLHYLITPEGLGERARLAQEYLEYSLGLYRHLRAFLARALSAIAESGRTRVALYGTGEVAEISALILQQAGVTVTGVVDDAAGPGATFLRQPVILPDAFDHDAFDWLLIASLKDAAATCSRLVARGVPAEKLVALELTGLPASMADAPGVFVEAGAA